jgi:hypothetical protein
MPYRTSDLCRVRAVKRIPACPTVSGDYAVLQAFCETCRGDPSTAYVPVPARLQ